MIRNATDSVLDRERKAEAYFTYLRERIREGFTGTVTVNFFRGGVTSLDKDDEPIIKVKLKETVRLR